MNNFDEIKSRNKKIISKLITDLSITKPLEEILSYESLQIQIEKSKNRVRLIGLLKVPVSPDIWVELEYKIKRIQLHSHKISEEYSQYYNSLYNFFKAILYEYKKIQELEDFEQNTYPYLLDMNPQYKIF